MKSYVSNTTTTPRTSLRSPPPLSTLPSKLVPRQWKPGFSRRFPLMGLTALSGAISCIAAAGVVLLLSNGRQTELWTLSPAVIIAIMSTVATGLVGYAQTEGAVISWWTKSLHGGSIKQLHRQWQVSNGLLSAALHSFPPNIWSLAKLAAVFSLVIGPILQRATSVSTVSLTRAEDKVLSVAQTNSTYNFNEVDLGTPLYSISNMSDADNLQGYLTPEFVQTISEQRHHKPLGVNGFLGNGTYTGLIETIGLNGSCEVIRQERYDWAKQWADSVNTTFDLGNKPLLKVSFD